MQIVETTQAFRELFEASAVTIGKYDGLHLGHQQILQKLIEQARIRQLPSVVILSEPQPEEFFLGDKAPSRLTSFDEKTDFLEKFGIDVVFKMHFDKQLSMMSAEDFVSQVLYEGLGVRYLIVGDDFRFGRQRLGDTGLLQELGVKFSYDFEAVDKVCHAELPGGSQRISSTLVRELLRQGHCETVRVVLGRHFSITGEVVHGRKLGRQIGVPTANIALAPNRMALSGVFAVQVSKGRQQYPAIANIGYRPTLEGKQEPVLEVHIFDFDQDIYEQEIRVSFLHKLRDEMKFDNVDLLRQQIEKDMQATRLWFDSQEYRN